MGEHESVTATLTAAGATDSIAGLYRGAGGMLNISIYGTAAWSATVSLKRRFGSSGSWATVKQYDYSDAVSYSIQEQLVEFEPGVQYKLEIDTGDYASGTVYLRLSR